MKYPFKRTVEFNIRAWAQTNHDLMATLDATISGAFDEEELADFCRQAVRDAKPLPGHPEMVFWGYDEPGTMPGDAIGGYFYLPGYLMVLIMIAGINRYPQMLELDGVRDALSRGLNGCIYGGLAGHGYDAMAILLENLMMFTKAGIRQFVHDHSDIGGSFGEMYEEAIALVRKDYENGKHIFDWARDYKKEQLELLELYRKSRPKAAAARTFSRTVTAK